MYTKSSTKLPLRQHRGEFNIRNKTRSPACNPCLRISPAVTSRGCSISTTRALGQRHLIDSGRPVNEVRRSVHVGAGVHPHGQAGNVAVVTAAQVHHPLQHDRRIVGPMRHAMPDRHRDVYPIGHLRRHDALRDMVRARHSSSPAVPVPTTPVHVAALRASALAKPRRVTGSLRWPQYDPGRFLRRLSCAVGHCHRGVYSFSTIQGLGAVRG